MKRLARWITDDTRFSRGTFSWWENVGGKIVELVILVLIVVMLLAAALH